MRESQEAVSPLFGKSIIHEAAGAAAGLLKNSRRLLQTALLSATLAGSVGAPAVALADNQPPAPSPDTKATPTWVLPEDNMKYYPPIANGYGIDGSANWVAYTEPWVAQRDLRFMKLTGMGVVNALTVKDSVLPYAETMEQNGVDVMVRFYSDHPEEMSKDDLAVLPKLAKINVKRAQDELNEANLTQNMQPGQTCRDAAKGTAHIWIKDEPSFAKEGISLSTPPLSPGGDCNDVKFLDDFMHEVAVSKCSFPKGVITSCLAYFDGRYGTPADLGVHAYDGQTDLVLPDGNVKFVTGHDDGFYKSVAYEPVMRKYLKGPYESIATEGGPDGGAGHKALSLAIRRLILSRKGPLALIANWILVPNDDPQRTWRKNAWIGLNGEPIAVDTINTLEDINKNNESLALLNFGAR